jgi:hypothetical protein
MDKLVKECDRCYKQKIVANHYDSTGFIECTGSLLLMTDIPKGKSGRESLDLDNKIYCPKCLLDTISEWIDKYARRKR